MEEQIINYSISIPGKDIFFFDDDEHDTIVSAGQMVLFRPNDRQVYHYYAEDKTKVYWVHFTGNQVEELLQKYEFPSTKKVFQCGVYAEYKDIFLKMIRELQLYKQFFENRLTLMLQDIFLLVRRNSRDVHVETAIQREIDKATRYFTLNYNKSISIADYAKEHFFSPYYFSQNFKKYTGFSPAQYIVSLRISNAQSMLCNYSYSISEIASLVGYNDPLYFSKIFKKHIGYSPTEYRQLFYQHDASDR